jgi:dihydropteroate synthase-like protein
LLVSTIHKDEIINLLSNLNKLNFCFDAIEIKNLYYLSKDEIIKNLPKNWESYDVIIVPGNLIWDFSDYGGKIVKGTESHYCLAKFLFYLDPKKFSPKNPVEKEFKDINEEINNKILLEVNEQNNFIYKIKNLRIPLRPPPMIIFSEVFLNNQYDYKSILDLAKNYVDDGSSAIVIGYIPGMELGYLKNLINLLKNELNVPIGLDAPPIILEKFSKDIDIIMSFTLEEYLEKKELIKDKASVVVINEINSDIVKKINTLIKNGAKIILDPLGMPPIYPGFLNSLIKARDLANKINAPIMIGLNNVEELSDVDSIGLNGLATFLSYEAGISIILTGEVSVKARGSVYEIKKAIDMASISAKLKKPPKDLSVNLLYSKEKDWFNNNKFKIYGKRNVIKIEFKGLSYEINCKERCPIGFLFDMKDVNIKEIVKISNLIYRYCLPWSNNWQC